MLQYDVRFINIYRDRLNFCIIKIGELQIQKYILKISESDDNLVYKFGGFTSTNSNY